MDARHTNTALRDGLVRGRLLPRDGDPLTCALTEDLLPTLRDAWESTTRKTQQRSTMLTWCERGLAQGAVLCGVQEPLEPLAFRLVWWPNGRPVATTVGILSSRIPHDDAARSEWRIRLRTVLREELAEHESLISVQGTTCDPWIRYWTARTLSPLQFIQIAKGNNLTAWRRRLVHQSSYAEPNRFPGFASPSVHLADSPSTEMIANKDSYKIPTADWILAQFASKLMVLYSRTDGGVDQLVKLLLSERQQLSNEQAQPYRGTLIDISSRQPSPFRSAGYDPRPPIAPIVRHIDRSLVDSEPGAPATSLLASRDFLLHCTRASSLQPESNRHLMNAWFTGQETHERSPIGTLKHILQGRKILAHSNSIRGRSAVVCFSDHSLNDLSHLRKYQPHRRRWDFEPVGVAIHRDALAHVGARPVLYGDDATWNSMNDSDRPFFQTSTGRRGKHDWTRESEWRVLGDVHLDELPPAAIYVFVESRQHIDAIANLSCWSVVCLETQRVYFQAT